MKLRNLIKNAMCVMFITLLLSTQCFSQLACELGIRANIYENANADECSGLAYHPVRRLFIMPLDDPINGNIHFKAYDIDTGGNASFNVAISDPNAYITKDDFEGLTYLNEDYFVLLEEKENKLYFLEYVVPDSGNPYFTVLSGHETTITLSNDKKDGLEGISYDPHTNRLYLVREKAYKELFSLPITLPYQNFTGNINETQISSVRLTFPGDAAGLFHLGKIYPSANQMSENILIVSESLGEIMEFKLELDSNDNLVSFSPMSTRLDIPNEPKPEGISILEDNIFIASEKSGGGLSSYKINPGAAFCNTNEKWSTETCSCEPLLEGCTDSNACNFDPPAQMDNGSCLYKYSTCDDGDNETINDRLDEDCNCKGIQACKCNIE